MRSRGTRLFRHLARPVGAALIRTLALATAADTSPQRDLRMDRLRDNGEDRRIDAATADLVQVGILFMCVFGGDNADAFFCASDIEPAVYRRIMKGRFRHVARGNGPDQESVPA